MSTTGNRFHVNNAALKSLQPIRDIMLNSRRENMTLHYEAFKALAQKSPTYGGTRPNLSSGSLSSSR